MPGETGVTVVTMLVCFLILHTRLRAHRAPGIPCALLFSKGGFPQQLGRYLRGEKAEAWISRDGISASPHGEERIFARLEP
jgi:hypothetical protein